MPRIIVAPQLEFLRIEARCIATLLGLRDTTIVLRAAPGEYSYVDSTEPCTVYLSLAEAERLGVSPARLLAHELCHVSQYLTRRLVVASEADGTWAWWDGRMLRIEDEPEWPWETEAVAFERQYAERCA